jgi:hypothetical protein
MTNKLLLQSDDFRQTARGKDGALRNGIIRYLPGNEYQSEHRGAGVWGDGR